MILALLIIIVLPVAVAVSGFLVARHERAALIERHIVGPTTSKVIDLGPHVYAGLPAPVRRYFDFAFNGQTEVTVHWVEWSERGDFLLPIGPFSVTGRQASRADAPVYAWTGIFWRFGLPVLESRDAFLPEGHDMRAKLLGWIRVMHTDYADPDMVASLHSYLTLRYYGQAPMMPWALLPNEHVAWRARDATSAYLEITRDGLAGRYLVSFGPDGRIESMETDRLLMEGNFTMQKEVGLKRDYRVVHGFRIPTRMDYRWTLEDGSLSSHYAFRLRHLRIVN